MDLWSVSECAAFLHRSRRWVYRALIRPADQKGSIPHVRVGRAPRFFPEDIIAWVRRDCPPASFMQDVREDKAKKVHQGKAWRPTS
jgi:hypothetical protein